MRESTFCVKVGRVAEPDESREKVQTGWERIEMKVKWISEFVDGEDDILYCLENRATSYIYFITEFKIFKNDRW